MLEGGEGDSHNLCGLCTRVAHCVVTASVQDCWALTLNRQNRFSQEPLGNYYAAQTTGCLTEGWCHMLENPQQRIELAALRTK